jgi:uncharacterized DUF497 family protein
MRTQCGARLGYGQCHRWTARKRRANLRKHGLDFVDAQALFDGRPTYTHPSPRPGERRFVTIGLLTDEFVALIRTERGAFTRLISPRRARDAEKRKYRAVFS